MKEQELNFDINEKARIYGTLNTPEQSTDSIIIFVHGLAGHMNEHQFFNAAKFFTNNNFAVYRFNFYDWRKKAKKLKDFTLKSGAKDLELIIKKLKNKGYKKINLVGHSYGGPTILSSNLDGVNSIAFWDPSSLNLKKLFSKKDFRNYKGLTIADWGVEIVISKQMISEANKLGNKLISAIKKIDVPIMIATAEKGILTKSNKKWYDSIKLSTPKKLITLKKAGHNFNELGVEEELFENTLKWFNKENK